MGVRAGVEQSMYENNLRGNCNPAASAEYSALLREMQLVVERMSSAADRLDRSARALLGGAR
jgi:hypothetical protein